MRSKIYPGQVLLDTQGKRVQAHGGSLFYENGSFYFYGENKEKTTGKSKIWTWGIRCYSSPDLYSWVDEGLIIPPNPDDRKSLLHPHHMMDRPHILHCKATGKYVCWVKFIDKTENCFAVLIADRFLGPYRVVREWYRPYGLNAGDFDFLQTEDGTAYLYFANNVSHNVVACQLSEDYTEVQGNYKTYYDGLPIPYCREGIAVFEDKGNVYMFTSSMTGYVPNPSQIARLSAPLGELTDLGNPHIADETDSSFHSQISTVFRHPMHPEVLIALADRWIPSFTFKPGQVKRHMNAIAACCNKGYHAGLKDILAISKVPMNYKTTNTSIADYVWLPIQFEDGRPVIRWRDAWRVEELVDLSNK